MPDEKRKMSQAGRTAVFPAALLFLLFCALSPVPLLPASGEAACESARACGTCHEEIYRAWSEGAHARTWQSILYHAARSGYMSVSAERDPVHCEACHAPIALATGDLHLLNPCSREGVTCDVCHTMRSPGQGGSGFIPSGGPVKSGPTGECPSGLHGCRKDEVLTTARLCGACHQYANQAGVPLYTEYAEWSEGSEAHGGRSCQDCHFAAGLAAAGPGGSHRLLPLEGQGELLEKALSLTASLQRQGEVIISVIVANTGAGHAVPGGPPLRSIVLDVRGYDSFGFEVYRDESVVFARLVRAPLSPDTGLEIPWLAWEEVRDDRIQAGEKKPYDFATGRSDIVKARVSLLYRRYRLHKHAEEILLGESVPIGMVSITVEAE
jgi:hypothetical protein